MQENGKGRGVKGIGLRAALLVLAAGLASCELDGRVPARRWERGDFHPDPGRRWEQLAELNVSSVVGWDDEIPTSYFPLALSVRSSSGVSRSVTMPAGLCFRPFDPYYTYMILLQDFTFTVTGTDTVILLPTWCANEERDEPEDESHYEVDLQAWDLEMKELYDLLEGKTVHDSIVDLDMVQEALWEITDGEGLTDSTRAWLESLK